MSSLIDKRFSRRTWTKFENPVVLIAPEGVKTEMTYLQAVVSIFQGTALDRFQKRIDVSLVRTPPNNQSSPLHRHEELKRLIQGCASKNYTAWQVCDRDEWNIEEFEIIGKWVAKDEKRRNLILSAPKFEYWLSLHFDKTTSEGRKALKKFDLDNHKEIRKSDFTYHQIVFATQNARKLYARRHDLYKSDGSQMFLLIEHLAALYGLESDFK